MPSSDELTAAFLTMLGNEDVNQICDCVILL